MRAATTRVAIEPLSRQRLIDTGDTALSADGKSKWDQERVFMCYVTVEYTLRHSPLTDIWVRARGKKTGAVGTPTGLNKHSTG